MNFPLDKRAARYYISNVTKYCKAEKTTSLRKIFANASSIMSILFMKANVFLHYKVYQRFS